MGAGRASPWSSSSAWSSGVVTGCLRQPGPHRAATPPGCGAATVAVGPAVDRLRGRRRPRPPSRRLGDADAGVHRTAGRPAAARSWPPPTPGVRPDPLKVRPGSPRSGSRRPGPLLRLGGRGRHREDGVHAHNAEPAADPGLDHEAAHLAAALSISGPSTPSRPRWSVRSGADHSGRRRRPLPGRRSGQRPTFPGAPRSPAWPSHRRRLKQAKITRVSLGYDASLFSRPGLEPALAQPATATRSRRPRRCGSTRAGSAPDRPARGPATRPEAATAFAAALRKQGIRVDRSGRRRRRSRRPEVASVSSMPLERIVEQVLMVSDNDAAEVIFRQVAVGRQGRLDRGGRRPYGPSSPSSASGPRHRSTTAAAWPGRTKVPADTMVKMLRLAADDEHPELRAVITGLPVAGVEGSLRSRYFDDAEPGRPRGGPRQDRHAEQGAQRWPAAPHPRRLAAGYRVLDQQPEERVRRQGLAGPGDRRDQHVRLSLTR